MITHHCRFIQIIPDDITSAAFRIRNRSSVECRIEADHVADRIRIPATMRFQESAYCLVVHLLVSRQVVRQLGEMKRDRR